MTAKQKAVETLPQKTGSELICDERDRQQTVQEYDSVHDSGHTDKSIPRAAVSYLNHYIEKEWVFNKKMIHGVDGKSVYTNEDVPDSWPWEDDCWKPKDPLTDLIRAGALIAAEIDRIRLSQGVKSDTTST